MAEARTASRVLADRILPAEGIAWDAARILAANILLILCSRIAVPLPWTPVPITGQTFGVLLIAVVLGARRGTLAVTLYLLEGSLGLPVFQPFGAAGAARFFGPTGGYLLAYPFATFLTGWVVERYSKTFPDRSRTRRSTIRLTSALLCGEFVIFAGGCAWLAIWLKLGFAQALAEGALPFLPGELVKLVLIVAAVNGLELAGRRT